MSPTAAIAATTSHVLIRSLLILQQAVFGLATKDTLQDLVNRHDQAVYHLLSSAMADIPPQVQDSPRLFGISCWLIPVFAGLAWCVTLLSLLAVWILTGSPHYAGMRSNQRYAYISDAGASWWGKPLFISGASTTAFLFTLTFFTERFLRHRGDLLHAGGKRNTTFSALASIGMILGGTGLILLTVFDARRHGSVHFSMTILFITGYILAALFMFLEKKRISKTFPHNVLIRRSWHLKLFFIVLEGCMSAIFLTTYLLGHLGTRNVSVFFEWTVAFLLAFYMWSFTVDFLPVPRDAQGRLLQRAAGMVPPDVYDNDQARLVAETEKLEDPEMRITRTGSAGRVSAANEKDISFDATAISIKTENFSYFMKSNQSEKDPSRSNQAAPVARFLCTEHEVQHACDELAVAV